MPLTFDNNVYVALLAEIQPKVISDEGENEKYLEVVEKLIDAKTRTPEENAILKLLVTLIEDFEEEAYQFPALKV